MIALLREMWRRPWFIVAAACVAIVVFYLFASFEFAAPLPAWLRRK